jgi:hypothetical protein
MVRYLMLLVFFLMFCTKKDDQSLLEAATITHADMRLCPSPCCGGWYIDIKGKTFQFLQLPEGSSVQSKDLEQLPLDVKVQWQPVKSICGAENLIEIIKIEL